MSNKSVMSCEMMMRRERREGTGPRRIVVTRKLPTTVGSTGSVKAGFEASYLPPQKLVDLTQ